jgi:TP901 family phage tail tape measure protein
VVTRTVKVVGRGDYSDLIHANGKAGMSTQQLDREMAKLEKQQAKTQAAIAATGKKLETDLVRQLDAATKKQEEARLATSKHAMLLGGGMVLGLGFAVAAFARFDAEMSNVGAASGATGQDLDALRQAALDAGQATVFSATDAARAEEELAKAGVSVQDVLSGGLIGSLNLATAGALDLGRAAEIAASTMTQFKLHGSDIPHIADLLAAGAGKAQGSVEDLGLALKYVGPVAGQMGVSLEETTGTLAELASNGILADSAGTGLRGVLMALTSPSAKAAGTMQDLGIQVYDAHGKFVGFRGVAEQLHRSLGGLSAQQRDVALGQIFGNEQIVAARILYAGGAAAVDDWTGKVNDSGYAARFAAERMNNLAGDVEQLKGSLETALIKSGSGANTSLRFLTQTTTGLVNAFAGLPGPLQAAGTGLLAVTGLGLAGFGAFGSLAPKVREARDALRGAGAAGQFADKKLAWMGRASLYGAGILALTVAVKGLYDHLSDVSGKVPDIDALTTSLKNLAAGKGADTSALSAEHLAGAIRDVNDNADSLGASIGRNFSGIGQLLRGNFEQAAIGTEGMKEAAAASRVEITRLDQSLATLATGGQGPAAAKAFGILTDQLRDQGLTVDEIMRAFPQYTQALKAADAEAALTGGAQDNLSAAIGGTTQKTAEYVTIMAGSKLTTDGLAASTKEASDALSEWNTEYDYLIGKNVDAVIAQANFKQALSDATKSLKDNKFAFDDNSDAGRANLKTIGDLESSAHVLSQAVLKQTGSQDEATLAYWRQIDAIRNLTPAGSAARAALDKLLGKMLGVSAVKVKPTIDANVTQALKNIRAVRDALNSINGKIAKTYLYNFTENITTAKSGGKIGQATGGIAGRDMKPPGPSDTLQYWLTPGEGVLTVQAVDRLGGPAVVDAMNAGHAMPVAAGAVPAGTAVVTGVGGGLSDGDRLLMRRFIRAADALVGLADRPAVFRLDSTQFAKANREANLRNAVRG